MHGYSGNTGGMLRMPFDSLSENLHVGLAYNECQPCYSPTLFYGENVTNLILPKNCVSIYLEDG